MTLRGIVSHGSQPVVKLIADSVLSSPDKIHELSAIGFSLEVTLPNDLGVQPIQHQSRHGMYGYLEPFRDELVNIRNGTAKTATLAMTGLELTLSIPESGLRMGVCVEGIVSNVVDDKNFTWPNVKAGLERWLVQGKGAAHCLRFAFLTSLADPSYVDDFRRDIDEFLGFLKQFSESTETSG